MKVELDLAYGSMTMLGDDELGDVGRDKIVFVLIVIVGTMYEHDHISILLDRTGLAQVRKDGAWIVATSDATRELGEGDDGDF